MKKIISIIILTVLFLSINPGLAAADSLVVSDSGRLIEARNDNNFDYRVFLLKNYLESHHSPLAESSEDFIAYADKYNIDWRFVPAISGVESTFGKRIPRNSFNAYGWANGNYNFKSWPDSIEIVSKTLREKYIDKGANSINEIARIYAPPSSDWSWKVEFFMKEIDTIPLSFTL